VNQFLNYMFSLTGRTAVVTGGSSGIGQQVAEALGRAGARVVLVARRPEPLRQAADQLRRLGCLADWRAADLAERAEVARVSDEVGQSFGEPDILVNAAAVNHRPPLATLGPETWDETLAVNLTAPFLMGQRFGPAMASRGWGRIIHVASQQAVRAYGNSGAYGAAKAGLTGLMRAQAEAWSRYGVCVNAIAPGIVRTPMTRAIFDDPDRTAALAARTMVGRLGEPADYAGIAVFLASRAADYITGQLIFVDGGFSAA
jgi:NAD(P)-dependent dehydrogenase (short-subunit alcohol dehydrogenase family)